MATTIVIIYSLAAFLVGMFILYRFKKNIKESSNNTSYIPSKNTLTEDLIYLSDEAKTNGIVNIIKQNPDYLLVAWFPATVKKYQTLLSQYGEQVYLATNLTSSLVNGKTIVLLERYPIKQKENILIEHLNPAKVIYISSLDDTLLKLTGSDRIKVLMEKMGAQPDEVITHSMISSSLSKAQEHIKKKMISDPEVNSAEEWFTFNKIEKIS